MGLGIYVHVPFCVSKCMYCDFTSYPAPSRSQIRGYLQAVLSEMELSKSLLAGRKAKSLYIGGGTPTVLGGGQLSEIIQACRRILHLGTDAEITVEANPGAAAWDLWKDLRAAGANRLSLGAQAFQDQLLHRMGRIHTVDQIESSFRQARAAGFNNINLDLIYGLPGQTCGQWDETLDRALELQPEHVSAYGLQVEKGTPWGDMFGAGLLSLPDEDDVLAMYRAAINELTAAGYRHYEISNFSLPGRQSAHNLLYWQNQEYIGLGPAAASRLSAARYTNAPDLIEYSQMVKEGQLPVKESEQLSQQVQLAETMFLGLRVLEGVDLQEFFSRFGVRAELVYGPQADRLKAQGLLEETAGRWRLTSAGLPVANEVFSAFL